MGDFGDKFRKAREKKELSLDDVSNVTKINARMLRAIEEENFDDLPGGVFNKGFIRAYAKHLGLDAEEAVTDYLACLRQAQIAAHELWEPQPHAPARSATVNKTQGAETRKPAPKPAAPIQIEELPELQLPRAQDVRRPRKDFDSPSPTIPWKLVAAAAIVLVLGFVLWNRHSRTTRAASSPPTVPSSFSASQAVAAAAPANQPLASATTSQPPANPSQPTPGTSPSDASMAPVAGSKQPARPEPKTSSTPVAAPSIPATSVQQKGDVTIRNFGKPSSPAPKKPTGSLALVIRATENSWVSVLADGQLVTQETLIAPAHTSVHATGEISVRIGNAAGVTFLWNGQEIPAQGAEAEVKTFVFDSTGMHVSSASPSSAQSP
jgi:cytoskeleton protein RodZ